MSDDLHNARSVVTIWRRNDHRHQWAGEALAAEPSTINRMLANVHRQLREALDEAADQLVNYGFLPGHAEVRNLRMLASHEADQANRANRWADQLAAAEAEA